MMATNRKLFRRTKTEKPRSKPDQRYARVELLLSDEQKQQLWTRANDAGLPVCGYLRQILFNEESEVNRCLVTD